MSVTVTGNLRLEPFLNPGPGEPLGTLIGAGGAAGDASGGIMSISWTLGAFVYLVRLISARMTAVAATDINLALQTGYQPGGTTEQFGQSFATPAVGTGETGFVSFIPPSIYAQPQDVDVLITIVASNPGAAVTFTGSFRALVFPENTLQFTDPSLLARFLI